jgi:hypothetical protein
MTTSQQAMQAATNNIQTASKRAWCDILQLVIVCPRSSGKGPGLRAAQSAAQTTAALGQHP